jgi:hypothetical protein
LIGACLEPVLGDPGAGFSCIGSDLFAYLFAKELIKELEQYLAK